MTKTNQIAIKRYGMTENQIREQYMESVSAKLGGMELVVAGILSDCQELTAMGRSEQVRQQLNVAKFILFEMKWPDN
jgi:hypothetical protein